MNGFPDREDRSSSLGVGRWGGVVGWLVEQKSAGVTIVEPLARSVAAFTL